MSKRAQILIEDCGVYLYDHIGGDSNRIFKVLHAALSRRVLYDNEYMAAIVFREMVKEDLDGKDRFGIGTFLHPDIGLLITINCGDETIVAKEDPNLSEEERKELEQELEFKSVRQCSFEELVAKGPSVLSRS